MQTKTDTTLPPQVRTAPPRHSVTARETARRPAPPQWHCDDRRRRAMVEHIAYTRAERRGFTPGQELQDWLAAEAEVERWLEGERYSGD